MKQRFNKLLAVLLTASLCVPMLPSGSAQAAASNVTFTEAESVSVSELGSERVTLFNEGWKFFFGDSDSAQNTDFNDASWSTVNLPHDFSITQNFTTSGEAESGFLPGGTGWYRKSFTLPTGCENKSLVLDFDGVYKDAYVYVNGTKVGEHHYGYTAFAFDISDYVICDGVTENVVAVKAVHNTPSSRWYSGSGIYRDVNLIVTDPVHVALDGTAVTTPNIANNDGTVEVKVDIDNDGTSSADVTVRNTVFDAEGNAVSSPSETSVTVSAGRSATAEGSAVVDNPDLWSIDDPNLYTLRTELLVNDAVVDTYESDFGFRWFEFDDTLGFSLNGEYVKLNGVCMHHDQGALGSAAYHDAMYRQLSVMKEMGTNAIRITHNPGSEEYIKICDELGLLVMEEFFDGWDYAKNGNSQDFSRNFMQNLTSDNQIIGGDSSMTWAEFVLKSTVKRDRNSPSVILWSLGNEIQEGAGTSPNFPSIADNLIKWTKEEDPSREVTSGDNTRGSNGTLNSVIQKITASGGIAGFNYANRSQLGTLHNTYGCIIASETSSAVNSRGIYMSQANNSNADGKYHLTSYDTSAVGWGKTAHDSMWDTLTLDYVAGEFIWTGFDYIGEPTPWNGTGSGSVSGRGAYPNSSYFGIVETTGFPKDTYYLYRSQWKQDDTTLHLVTAWDEDNLLNRNGKTPVVIYSNAPVVKLYRDDTLVGTATREEHITDAGHIYYTYTTESNNTDLCQAVEAYNADSLYITFNVAYKAGTIRAEACNADGSVISDTKGSSSISTPDAAIKLNAAADKDEITADGSSLSYITIDVTDDNDVLDTTATNTINLSLTGNGEIVGVDNGDQASTDKYQQASVLKSANSALIKAYAGKALVIVRSTKEKGSFTLTASADGLSEASVTVDTVADNASGSSAIASYRLPKHFYAPVGISSVTLPATVEVSYTDGSKRELPITWASYDKANLSTVGSFKIDGSFKDGNQTIDLFITGHMYGDIKTAENFSVITSPGLMPTLPTSAMTYFADGSEFESFPITWDLDKVQTSDLTVGKILDITGTVTAFGTTLKTTASVRVAEPIIGEHTNMGTEVLHLTDNGPYSDTLASVTDGVREDNGTDTGRWSTWDLRNDATFTKDAVITVDWATATTLDQINLFCFYQGADNEQSQLPTNVKFEYAVNCSWDGKNIISDEWKEVKYEAPTSISANHKWTKGYSYKLKETINPVAVRISLGHDVGYFIGLNEIEFMRPTIQYKANSSAALDNILVDGKAIPGFEGTKTEYTLEVTSIKDLQVENSSHAAVTIIPVSNKQFKIITVSEDGSETLTYTITMAKAPDDPLYEQRTDAQNKLAAAKAVDPKPYTADSYAKYTQALAKIEASLKTASSESQINALLKDLENAKALLVKAPVPPVNTLKNGDTIKAKSGVTYKVISASKKTVAAVKYDKKKKTVIIPATVKIKNVTCKVVQIGKNAFKGATKLTKVTIGKNVTYIGSNAFYGCRKLSKVTFKGTAVKTIKKGAFKKTASKITVSVPKSIRKNKRAAKAFTKKLTKAGMSKKLRLK